MQNKEQILEAQTIFSRRHIGLLIVLLLFLANNFIFNNEKMQVGFVPSLVISSVLMLDIFLAYNNFFHKFPLLVMVRYIEVIAVGVLINDLSDGSMSSINNILVILFYSLFLMEIILLYDMTELRYSLGVSLLCQLPFVVDIIIICIRQRDNFVMRSLDYASIGIISFMVTWAIATYYGKTQKYYEQYMFSRDRLLDRAKDNSDKINESQKNLRTVNEQLGIKKFELEEAYRKINNVNADMEFQNHFMTMMMSTLNLGKLVSDAREMLNQRFLLKYSELVFVNETVRAKYQTESLESVLGEEEAQEFYDFFLSDLFIQEHSAMGSRFMLNQVDYDEFPFFKRAEIVSVAISTLIMDDADNKALYIMLSREKDAFSEKDMLFSNIFGQMEVVARNISLYYEIRQMSIMDALTGIYNRRYLNVYFNDNFINSEVKKTVSAAMVDIDFFKSINDTYGHLFGDMAIKTVAKLIGASAKANGGEAFRYGGEEFVIILEDKSLSEAAEIMEELRLSIKDTPVKSGDVVINLNVSIGVTAYPDIAKDISTLIDRADKAMYYSKQHGRDRLTLDDGSD
ncbi:MAG: GGDEF domain-containing protein [Butyrivibrio sp.]|nr:GGDEF domain-containing protein [Butyrivibrio sp.]